MKINSKTKISEIIKENAKAIDVIAAIHPHFNKLRNPIIRKVMAHRVTITDAARIGKCTVKNFFDVLQSIGFEIEQTDEKQNTTIVSQPVNIKKAISTEQVVTLDVREDISKGEDPFHLIMEAINKLPEHYALKVVNSFEPIPLIKILKNKGYEYFVDILSENELHTTFFIKQDVTTATSIQQEKKITSKDIRFEDEKQRFGNNIIEVDVRDMEMPLPMITILNKTEELPDNTALLVHHKKVPQHLLPELDDRKLTYLIQENKEGDVKLLIYK